MTSMALISIDVEQQNYNQRASMQGDEIQKMKQIYQTLFEENSSYKQSLLVSPHCSKFERRSPSLVSPHCFKFEGRSPSRVSPRCSKFERRSPFHYANEETSLFEYTKPLKQQTMNRTETKKTRKKNMAIDLRKQTESDPIKDDHEGCFHELRRVIDKKDERIRQLEQSLDFFQASKSKTVMTCKDYEGSCLEQFRSKENLKTKHNCGSHDLVSQKIRNFQREVAFLSRNNQQLYEEVHKLSEENVKVKHILSKTLLYTRELEDSLADSNHRLQQTVKANRKLLKQREIMVQSYEEELQLFQKMKKSWQQNEAKRNQSNPKQTAVTVD